MYHRRLWARQKEKIHKTSERKRTKASTPPPDPNLGPTRPARNLGIRLSDSDVWPFQFRLISGGTKPKQQLFIIQEKTGGADRQGRQADSLQSLPEFYPSPPQPPRVSQRAAKHRLAARRLFVWLYSHYQLFRLTFMADTVSNFSWRHLGVTSHSPISWSINN